MVSDVPLGAFLSGGLDPSAIAALAKRHDPNIQCFTIDTADSADGFKVYLPRGCQTFRFEVGSNKS